MPGHVAVQDLPTPVLDAEETVEQMERHRRYGEEVESDDDLTVVVEKCQPPLSRIATAPHSAQITSHSLFGDLEAQLE